MTLHRTTGMGRCRLSGIFTPQQCHSHVAVGLHFFGGVGPLQLNFLMVRRSEIEPPTVGSWLLIFTFKINWFRLSALLLLLSTGTAIVLPALAWLGWAGLAKNFSIAIIAGDYFSFDRPCTALAVTASSCCGISYCY